MVARPVQHLPLQVAVARLWSGEFYKQKHRRQAKAAATGQPAFD
ncbi:MULTISPECIES: hypothetical protein [unclassified Polaromonas]|jgi:hypothetical protein|nr:MULTISPECIES: hypothetical protein [unclassified Polaromonas]HQS86688.1 hypothetical protein [Polaromonas sp.]